MTLNTKCVQFRQQFNSLKNVESAGIPTPSLNQTFPEP